MLLRADPVGGELEFAGGVQATYLEVKPISINEFSNDKNNAWELVKILTSKEFVATANRIGGFNPPRKDGAALPEFKDDWWEQAFVAQLPTGVALAPINWGLVIN